MKTMKARILNTMIETVAHMRSFSTAWAKDPAKVDRGILQRPVPHLQALYPLASHPEKQRVQQL